MRVATAMAIAATAQAARMARNSLSVIPGFTRRMVAAAGLRGKRKPPPGQHSSLLLHIWRRRQEHQVKPRLRMLRIEQQRLLVLLPRSFGAAGDLIGVAQVVVPARIPGRELDAGLPQRDLAPVVALAVDAGH